MKSHSQPTSADGHALTIGATVYIRFGGEYPVPGRWRVSTCVIQRIKRTGTLRLKRVNGHRGCDRQPTDVYTNRSVANGTAGGMQ
jgi:hypothetical protein